jgi:hypothetical protein
MYYGTLRYLTNALRRSRLVNVPKTQAVFDYESLSKQWLENYEDRLNSANDLLISAATYQVLYYDGLRFQDELQSIKTILPSLRHRVVEVMKKLEATLGNKKQWDLCQSQIAEKGESELIQIHNRTHVVIQKIRERYLKRVKQHYISQQTQPKYVPKFQQMRNSYDEERYFKYVYPLDRLPGVKIVDTRVETLKVEEERRKKNAEKLLLEKKRELKRIESQLKKAKMTKEKLHEEAKGIKPTAVTPVVLLDKVKDDGPFPSLSDGRRVVCYIDNKRVLPKKRKSNEHGAVSDPKPDPRPSRVWGKGLPMIENVILKKEKGVQFVPKRRRVVCILNNERVEPKK